MCKGALYDARIEYHHKLLSLSAVTRALCVGRLERPLFASPSVPECRVLSGKNGLSGCECV